MFYREAGQYKTTYAADMAIFPIRQDRYGLVLILFVAFVVIPAFGNPFIINSMMIPFLILSLAGIGLNLLTGYTGLLSLGTGAFMGVGAYACYKLETFFPQVNILVWIVMRGSSRRWWASPSACRASGSRASTWRWRRSPPSSFSNGASPACRGSSITTIPARSKCRPRPCSACP